MADITFCETFWDVMEKLQMATGVLWHALPGGKFAFGEQVVRGVPMRVWTNLQPSLIGYLRPFFKQWGDKQWIVYQEQEFTFRQAEQMFDAFSAELASFGVCCLFVHRTLHIHIAAS